MQITISEVVAVIIQARYQGGLEKFEEEGGRIGMAPGTPEELLVYHPALPVEIKNMITEVTERAGLLLRCVTTLNYEGHSKEEIFSIYEDKFENLMEELGLTGGVIGAIGELSNVFIIKQDLATRKTAETLVEKLREAFPNCIRTYVMYGEDKILRAEYSLADEPVRKGAVVLEAHSRQTVINDDDLLDLKIALETQSVDDFINSL